MDRAGVSQTGAASRTAMMAAAGRSWHLFCHGPRAVLSDWLGWALVGSDAETMVAGFHAAFGPLLDPLTTWASARSRIVEDWLAASGAEEYVILGAGLDSFAWRQPGGVRVCEVDHPATQEWKRSRLQAIGVPVPPELVWVPVDFEVESVRDGLERAALGPGPVFVSWIAVTPYLSLDAIAETLRGLPPCSLAVSYATPPHTWGEDIRDVSETFRTIADASGEPVVSVLTPDQFAGVLGENGFERLEDVGAEDVEGRYGVRALSLGNERVALARNHPR